MGDNSRGLQMLGIQTHLANLRITVSSTGILDGSTNHRRAFGRAREFNSVFDRIHSLLPGWG